MSGSGEGHEISTDYERESKFKRRTSHHNLKLDVEKATAAALSGIGCTCNQFFYQKSSIDKCQIHGMAKMESDPQVAEQGKELFQNFVLEQIRKERLTEAEKCLSPLCK